MESIDAVTEPVDPSSMVVDAIGSAPSWELPEEQKGAVLVVLALLRGQSIRTFQDAMMIGSSDAKKIREEIEVKAEEQLKAETELQVNQRKQQFWKLLTSSLNLFLGTGQLVAGAALVPVNPGLAAIFFVSGAASAATEFGNLTDGFQTFTTKLMPEASIDERQELATRIHDVLSYINIGTSIGLLAVGAGAAENVVSGLNYVGSFVEMGRSVSVYRNGTLQGRGTQLTIIANDANSESAMLNANLDLLMTEFRTVGEEMNAAAQSAMKASTTDTQITKAAVSAASS